jgi:hypothetical protein
MTGREHVADFTAGVMQRLREAAGIGDVPPGFVELEDGWDVVVPGGVVQEFRWIFGHMNGIWPRRFGVRQRRAGAAWPFRSLGWVADEDEALEVMGRYLRGVEPS